MVRLLVTGFDAFAGSTINASQHVATSLKSRHDTFEIVTGILPTSYTRAGSTFFELKNTFQPNAALCLGESVGRTCLHIEQLATNFANSPLADNDGLVLKNTIRNPNEQTAYQTTLASDRLVAAAIQVGVPATISFSAGSFVCNALYYDVLKDSANSKFPVCFVHLPGLPASVLDKPQVPSMSLEVSLTGIEAICAEIALQFA